MLLPTDKHINNPLEEEEPYHLEIPLKCTICGSIFKRWDQVSDHAVAGHNMFDEYTGDNPQT
jgi:hypothetical protein